jgi:hypothetical protein
MASQVPGSLNYSYTPESKKHTYRILRRNKQRTSRKKERIIQKKVPTVTLQKPTEKTHEEERKTSPAVLVPPDSLYRTQTRQINHGSPTYHKIQPDETNTLCSIRQTNAMLYWKKHSVTSLPRGQPSGVRTVPSGGVVACRESHRW